MVSTIIEFLIILVAHAAYGMYSATLKYSKKITYLIWGTWVVLQSALLFCAEFVLKDVGPQFFVGYILSLLGQYIIFFGTTKGRLAQRVFTMLTYSIFFCIFMALFSMVKGTFPNRNIVLLTLINALMFFCVVYYFLRHVCPLYRAAAKNITTGWGLLIFVNIFFLIMVILSSVFPVRLTCFNDPSVITFIFLSVSILVVYPVIFSNIINMSEVANKREIERQNKILLTQIEMENMQITADSQSRHDRRHHNLVMLEFANAGDIESVREYLKNLVESEDDIWGEVKYCKNMTVNTVLTVYERRARENGIVVRISANAGRELAVLPQDIVIVIANLFENAINATSKLKNKTKLIDIFIKESVQRLLVKVENPCRDNLTFDEALYGIGISSVITTTSKYDGMYDFSAEDGIFVAKISLNLK